MLCYTMLCFPVLHSVGSVLCAICIGKERQAKHQRTQVYSHIVDQKPIHENEAESSGRGTLSWKGMPTVALKSNMAASRTRISLNNMGTDDPDFPTPVEVTWKLRTSRYTDKLKLPEGVNISVRFSGSGSYDADTFIAYLEQWIPKWDAEREGKRDYRLMFLDDYRVHNMEKVKQFLWTRGFFRVKTVNCVSTIHGSSCYHLN